MKRFFEKAVSVVVSGGYEVHLDATPLRHLKTKMPFLLPTAALAADVADEWDKTSEHFSLSDLPLTCFLMGAQALSEEQKNAIVDKILQTACCDTICCLTETPSDLHALQQEKWLPIIQKINAIGGDFYSSTSLFSQELTDKNKKFLQNQINSLSNYELACLQQLCAIYSSIILALGIVHNFLSSDEAFDLSVLEETYQNRFWPEDKEAVERRDKKRQSALFYATILKKLSEEKES